MPWTTLHWKSDVIGKATSAEVLLPTAGKPPFPVFYLLHGLSDDASVWMRHTRIEYYARELPLVVVMPDGYRGFYTDNEAGPAFAKHIGVELPAVIERHFRVKATRAGRAIGGLSMGGYGALRIGLGYPGRFCSVNAHSAAVGLDRLRGRADYRRAAREHEMPPSLVAELQRIFGLAPRGTSHDLVQLARRAQRARRLPRLLLDCGTEDYLIGQNRELHASFNRAKIPHLYREFPGRHDWDYWDLHVREALEFHSRNLGAIR
ncbi:MAG: alpha/beta hydrolase [Opitutales bacterium]